MPPPFAPGYALLPAGGNLTEAIEAEDVTVVQLIVGATYSVSTTIVIYTRRNLTIMGGGGVAAEAGATQLVVDGASEFAIVHGFLRLDGVTLVGTESRRRQLAVDAVANATAALQPHTPVSQSCGDPPSFPPPDH